MLFFTGLSRMASDVARQIVASLEDREDSMHRMAAMVDEALEILRKGSLEDFGHLMDEAWHLKRALHPAVTTSLVDKTYQTAREAGALGGKLLGAGGGGFLLLFVPPNRRRHVQNALSDLLYVPFEFEPLGSQIIVYDPEQDYSHLDPIFK
jgi:D-glycero-alpha-D-manno-heptose-7-phosphate kinase